MARGPLRFYPIPVAGDPVANPDPASMQAAATKLGEHLRPVASIAGGVVGAYHGYKRNGSIIWAAVWAAAGALMPVPTVAYAAGQGIGKRKGP